MIKVRDYLLARKKAIAAALALIILGALATDASTIELGVGGLISALLVEQTANAVSADGGTVQVPVELRVDGKQIAEAAAAQVDRAIGSR